MLPALQSTGQHGATIGLVHALERAIAALLVPVLVPGLLLAGIFLGLWLGDFATAELTAAFRLLLIACAILSFAVPVSNVIVASGESGISARYSWLTVVVVFGAMYFAVPRFGLIGAAGSMLFGYSTSLFFAASARRALGFRRRKAGVDSASDSRSAVRSGALIAALEPGHGVGRAARVGRGAWASFYVVRALLAVLTPEETAFPSTNMLAASKMSRSMAESGRNRTTSGSRRPVRN